MSTEIIVAILLALGGLVFFIGVARARGASDHEPGVKMHSRLGYYGAYVMLWTVLPALVAALVWAAFTPTVLSRIIQGDLPAEVQAMSGPEQALIMAQVRSVADGIGRLSTDENEIVRAAGQENGSTEAAAQALKGNGVILGSSPKPYIIAAGYDWVVYRNYGNWTRCIVVALLALGGFLYAYTRIHPRLPARNAVESVILGGLILASTVAILTTLGIVLSVAFESIRFFQEISPSNFYLGTVWDPRFTSADANRGEGQFGFLPLLWGTLYISIVALLVAVPVGLYAAIYLSEYASDKVRAVVKPMLEILAGIPTIVYGFFALITFGPFMRDLGDLVGLEISATSVLTAGMVMGIMIIPFVSSLSDDIISSVPQSLREGSLGLGATKSETIKRVILPAALPGIVGAVLLAASRAIGETMIVVLAAGIAANLTLNPFEPVTTITVKIVSQLTGDHEFNSPQTLVAFALGLTLFVVTLALNVYALYIVRKYKEQYE